MKRLSVFLLSLIMLFPLAACKFGGSTDKPDDETSTQLPEEKPGDNPGEKPEEKPDDNPGGNGGQTPPPAEEDVTDRFSDEATAKNASFYKKYSSEEKDLYYTLWQSTTKVGLRIDITPYELAKIDEAYKDYKQTHDSTKIDTYRKCNLTITVNGSEYYYEEVGVRMRGNTSKREFCNADGSIYDYVHLRFSFNETFDGDEYAEGAWGSDIATVWPDKATRKARDNRTFATMKKVYYKWNKNYDNTYIREVYANKAFRAYGILAPHITLTQVELMQKGSYENLGVAALYETVDKQFIKRNFPEDNTGDLYKCTYTTGPANLASKDSYGIETPTQQFNYSLKTNDDRTAPDYNHHKYLLGLIDVLAVNRYSDSFKERLEQIVDMNYFTNFEAVNYMLGNPDCIRNNSNNYYIYFAPASGKAYFIPYDYDRCLGINVDWNPSGNGMTAVGPYSTHGVSGDVSNPLYRKTILEGGLSEYKELYKSKLQSVLNGEWFKYDNFKSEYDKYSSNYAASASPSQTIIEQCGGRINASRFVFSEMGTDNLSATDDNVSVQRYLELKRAFALANL